MNSNCEALASGSSSTGSSSHCSSGAGEIGRGAVPRRRRAGPGAGAAAGAGGGSLVVSAGAGAAGVASSSVWGRRAVFRRSSNVGPESSDLWPASLSCPRDPVSAAVLRRGEVRGGAGAGAGVGAGAAACAGARGARGRRAGLEVNWKGWPAPCDLNRSCFLPLLELAFFLYFAPLKGPRLPSFGPLFGGISLLGSRVQRYCTIGLPSRQCADIVGIVREFQAESAPPVRKVCRTRQTFHMEGGRKNFLPARRAGPGRSPGHRGAAPARADLWQLS